MASNFAEKYREFMAGRNGVDRLSRDLAIGGLLLLVITVFIGEPARGIAEIVGLAVLLYAYFRMFSRDIDARTKENDAFVARIESLTSKLPTLPRRGSRNESHASSKPKDKEHKYFSCPACGQAVRVPKGAGKIRVTCPKCGEKFEKKA